MKVAQQYYQDLSKIKEASFNYYKEKGITFERKQHPRGLGTTWGYRLSSSHATKNSQKTSGSSIGEDEIKLFYDICSLISPSASYVIGHSFGFSTLVLALSNPEGVVIAIDNWSEGSQLSPASPPKGPR